MKLESLIKYLKEVREKRGNIEILLADRPISCNHMYGEHSKFKFYKTYTNNNRAAILMGIEDPYDSIPPDEE